MGIYRPRKMAARVLCLVLIVAAWQGTAAAFVGGDTLSTDVSLLQEADMTTEQNDSPTQRVEKLHSSASIESKLEHLHGIVSAQSGRLSAQADTISKHNVKESTQHMKESDLEHLKSLVSAQADIISKHKKENAQQTKKENQLVLDLQKNHDFTAASIVQHALEEPVLGDAESLGTQFVSASGSLRLNLPGLGRGRNPRRLGEAIDTSQETDAAVAAAQDAVAVAEASDDADELAAARQALADAEAAAKDAADALAAATADSWLTTTTDGMKNFKQHREHTRCEGTNHGAIQTAMQCKDKAVELGHDYSSFTDSWGINKCTTADDCTKAVSERGWTSSKRWYGLWNATHAFENPKNELTCELTPHDKTMKQKEKKKENDNYKTHQELCKESCLTNMDESFPPPSQKAATRRYAKMIEKQGSRSYLTCTSCNSGFYLVIRHGNTRSGTCEKPVDFLEPGNLKTCINLDTGEKCTPTDERVYYFTQKDKPTSLWTHFLTDDVNKEIIEKMKDLCHENKCDLDDHGKEIKGLPSGYFKFEKKPTKSAGQLFPVCRTVKEVVCIKRENSGNPFVECDTHSENECLTVCRGIWSDADLRAIADPKHCHET